MAMGMSRKRFLNIKPVRCCYELSYNLSRGKQSVMTFLNLRIYNVLLFYKKYSFKVDNY